ncbi:hypothetical protein CHARACLAT_031869 [Characodon lateralis]|uniref:Uncharacterized protein n=1 Tax=Characodon lateralis TaxID=208331 RepID=A0ABU7FAU9_9TELE|nr:hypothetical protein [Characodon lateralis]
MTRLHRCWSAGVQLHILEPEGNNWIGVMMPAHWSFLRPKFKMLDAVWSTESHHRIQTSYPPLDFILFS